jgi:transketolase
VEAAATFGWERYTTEDGASHGIDRFGASAPWDTNMEKFGFTGPHLAETFKKMLKS